MVEKFGPVRGISFNETITQIEAGKFHSLFLAESGKVYSLGFNMHGQAGLPNSLVDHVEEPTEVFTEGMNIVKIAAGNHHNLLLNDKGELFGFGSRAKGQIDGRIDIGRDEQWAIFQIDLPSNSKVKDIKAHNIRSAAILESGEAYHWGGFQYLKKKVLREGFELINEQPGIPTNANIVDFQMGFAHDVVMTEDDEIEYIEAESEPENESIEHFKPKNN